MYTAEQKCQIEVIKNSFYTWGEFDDYVLIVDGYKGVYIHKKQLRVVLDPNRKVDMDKFNHDGFEEYKKAHLTKHLYAIGSGRVVRKIKSDDTEIWVREDWLKQYRDAVSYYIKDPDGPVILFDRASNPIGLILPVKINTFDE